MDCRSAEELISSVLDGEAEAGERTALEGHMATCGPCRALWNEVRTQDTSLRRALVSPRRSTTDLAAHIVERLPVAPRQARASRLRRVAALAAGVATIALTVFLVRRDDDPRPAAPVFATASFVTGAVEARTPPDGSWLPLVATRPVAPGDEIRTGDLGRCELAVDDGDLIRLDRATHVVLGPVARRMKVLAGKVWLDAAPAFIVEAAGLRAVSGDASRFELRGDATAPAVAVLTGAVGVTAGDDVERTVVAGEQLRCADGACNAIGGDVVLASSWVHDILKHDEFPSAELEIRTRHLLDLLAQAPADVRGETELRALGSSCSDQLSTFLLESDRTTARDRAAALLADVAPCSSIGILIRLLDDADGDVRRHAARALARLTGQDFGVPPEAWTQVCCRITLGEWNRWWEENRHRFELPARCESRP